MTNAPNVSENSNPEMSKFIYGTWRLSDGDSSPEAILKRIKLCLQLGITTFDCADIYGGVGHVCEKIFGEALKLEPLLRNQMQIVTKCGIVCPSEENGCTVKHYDLSFDYITTRLNQSLDALGISTIDVLLIHRPSPMMDVDEIALAFNTLRMDNKVKYFGVSNFTPFQIQCLQSRLDFPLITNQIEFNPLCLDPLHDGTLDYAQQFNMKPMIWSPLAGGSLMQSNIKDERTARVQDVLKRIASELGPQVTIDQVIFAWILAHPSKPNIILGTNKLDRISNAIKSSSIKLTKQNWFSIWEASMGKQVP